jgi:hypothetical protein
MSLEDLFQLVLNVEEAANDPGKVAEGNPQNSKDTHTKTTIPRKQGGEKVKIIRKVEENPLV